MISDIKNKSDNILLQIKNHHKIACGDAPDVDAKGKRLFYFENDYGEQLVLVGDKESADLWRGDCSWCKPIEVTKESVITLWKPMFSTLNKMEFQWLLLCCQSMGMIDEYYYKTINTAVEQMVVDMFNRNNNSPNNDY